MNRRAAAPSSRQGLNEKFSRLVCLLMALLAVATPSAAHAIEAPADEIPNTDAEPVPTDVPADAPTDPDVPRPPVTANEFIPEDRDLTACIGVLERPGCGSEQRGGWRQTAVLGAIFLGLLVVFGNVIRGVRKRNG